MREREDDDVVVISDSRDEDMSHDCKEREAFLAQQRHHAIAVAAASAASAAHRAELVRQHAVQSSSPPAPGIPHRPLERAQSSPSVTLPLSPQQTIVEGSQDVTMKPTFTTGKWYSWSDQGFQVTNFGYKIHTKSRHDNGLKEGWCIFNQTMHVFKLALYFKLCSKDINSN